MLPIKKGFITVFVTAPSLKDALKIADVVIGKHCAACVNIIRNIKSVYRWKGKIENAFEFLLIIKTKAAHFERLKRQIQKIHPYEVPEIIALPIIAGNKKYLKWIDKEVK